jgi:phosphoribosyl 1,2-cyclic phosphodiesterase
LTVTIRFWGTRGSIATPGPETCRYGGNTSSVELQVDQQFIVCDAGTGLRPLGLDWLHRATHPTDVHLFLSHTHFDHIQGFPFFAPVFQRDVTVFLYDPSGRADSNRDRILGQMAPAYCPVSLRDLAANIVSVPFERRMTLGSDLAVEAVPQVHPGGSWGYAFEHAGMRLVYATDSELDMQLLNAKSDNLGPEDARRFAPEVLALYDNADFVIADAQYSDEEYALRRGWGHARFNTVVDLAIAARVRRLALFHHDPHHTDSEMDQLVEQARARARRREADLEIFAAMEGASITF